MLCDSAWSISLALFNSFPTINQQLYRIRLCIEGILKVVLRYMYNEQTGASLNKTTYYDTVGRTSSMVDIILFVVDPSAYSDTGNSDSGNSDFKSSNSDFSASVAKMLLYAKSQVCIS